MSNTIYVYKEDSGWYDNFKRACGKVHVDYQPFTDPKKVPEGSRCFVRVNQQDVHRERSRAIVRELHKKDCVTLPTLQEAEWYDHKGKQIKPLKRWLPKTFYIKDFEEAEKKAHEIQYPIISKAVDGAGSKTTRIINSVEEALDEATRAFSKSGIHSVYGRKQKNYVYWQNFIPNNPCDYRPIICDDMVFGLIRENRKDQPFASGSGRSKPMTTETKRERIAMETAAKVADALGTKWLAIDIVFDERDKPYVLELSSAWTMDLYTDCPMYKLKDLSETKYSGKDMMTIAVEILQNMESIDDSEA